MPTSRFGWPYPAASSAPNVPVDLKLLADSADATVDGIEQRIAAIEAAYARGRIATTGNVQVDSTTFGLTETLLWSITFTSVSPARLYMMKINSGWTMSSGTATFRLRWAVGGTVTTSSAPFGFLYRQAPQVASGYNRLEAGDPTVSGLTAGTVTVGLCAFSDAPTDGKLIGANDNFRRWEVYDMGV